MHVAEGTQARTLPARSMTPTQPVSSQSPVPTARTRPRTCSEGDTFPLSGQVILAAVFDDRDPGGAPGGLDVKHDQPRRYAQQRRAALYSESAVLPRTTKPRLYGLPSKRSIRVVVQPPATPNPEYQPPASADIAAAQNQDRNLRLLLAQRRIYAKAKWWALLRSLGISLIAIAAPLITAIVPRASVALGAVAGVWIFLSRTVFAAKEEALAAKGAAVQEEYDQAVFAMPDLALRKPQISLEDLAALAGEDSGFAQALAEEDLRDWYPVDTTVGGNFSVAIAQRANAAYAERLLAANANIWLALTIAWALIAVVISLMLELGLATFLLGVALPLLPALLDVFD